MTIHFAAARSASCSPIARALARRALGRVANDNGAPTVSTDRVLHAALRHFAEHGMGAAREARAKAEEAFFAGDRQAYDWWLEITRTLDRRMALNLQQSDSQLPHVQTLNPAS